MKRAAALKWILLTLLAVPLGMAGTWACNLIAEALKPLFPALSPAAVGACFAGVALVAFAATVGVSSAKGLRGRFLAWRRRTQLLAEHADRVAHAPWMKRPLRCPRCGSSDIFVYDVFDQTTMLHRARRIAMKMRQVIWGCNACFKRFGFVTWYDDGDNILEQSISDPPL